MTAGWPPQGQPDQPGQGWQQPGWAPPEAAQPGWAPPPGPPPKKSRWPLFLVLGIVIVLMLCGGTAVGGYLVYKNQTGGHHGSASGGRKYPSGATGMTSGLRFGNLTGASQIQVWEDLSCPPCKTMHQSIQPTIDKLLNSGQDKWGVEYLPVKVTGEPARRAANALACAEGITTEKDVLTYQDTLYANQPAEGTGYTPDDLVKAAPSGISGNSGFRTCVSSMTYGAWVDSITSQLSTKGFNSVPVVLVNGQQIDTKDPTAFAQAVGG